MKPTLFYTLADARSEAEAVSIIMWGAPVLVLRKFGGFLIHPAALPYENAIPVEIVRGHTS